MLMDNFVIGTMVWNGGLVVVVGFLIKNWMDGVKITMTENKEDLKSNISTNRTFYQDTYHDLKKDIGEIYELQRIQNGNVAKVTAEIATQVALCKGRNEGRRTSDRCNG